MHAYIHTVHTGLQHTWKHSPTIEGLHVRISEERKCWKEGRRKTKNNFTQEIPNFEQLLPLHTVPTYILYIHTYTKNEKSVFLKI